jgi:WD40 repeat protein
MALPTATPAFPETRITAATLPQIELLRSVGFGGAQAAAIAPGNRLLAVATTAGVALFEMASLRHLRFDPFVGGAQDIAFAEDGQTLMLTAGSLGPQERQVRRVEDGALLTATPSTAAPSSLQMLSPDEQLVAVFNQPDSSPTPGIRISRVGTAQQLYTDDSTEHVAFSPDSSLIALVAYDGMVRLLDARGTTFGTLDLPAYWSVGFSPDGQTMVAAGRSVRVWDVVTSALRQQLTGLALAGESWVTGAEQWVRFSPDGALLTIEGSYTGFEASMRQGSTWAIGADGSTHAWDSSAGGMGVINFRTYVGAISPATKAVAQTDDGVALTVDRGDGQPYTLQVPPGVAALAFSPDGALLAVADKAGTIQLIQTATGTIVQTIKAATVVQTLAFSPDGTLLGGYGDDGTSAIWAVSDGALIRRVAAPPRVSAAASSIRHPPALIFTNDNALVIVLADRAVRFYRVADGTLLHELAVSAAGIAIGPRQRLLGLVHDGRIELWGIR